MTERRLLAVLGFLLALIGGILVLAGALSGVRGTTSLDEIARLAVRVILDSEDPIGRALQTAAFAEVGRDARLYAHTLEPIAWADAGYYGWPGKGTTPLGDRPQCSATCPKAYAGPGLTVNWQPKRIGPR